MANSTPAMQKFRGLKSGKNILRNTSKIKTNPIIEPITSNSAMPRNLCDRNVFISII
jgi:hypothetical protein